MEVCTNQMYDDVATEQADENYYHALTESGKKAPAPPQLKYDGPNKRDWESHGRKIKSFFIASLVVNIVLLVGIFAVVIYLLVVQSSGRTGDCKCKCNTDDKNTEIPPNTFSVSVGDNVSKGVKPDRSDDEGGPTTSTSLGASSSSTQTPTVYNNWGMTTSAYVPLWGTYCRNSLSLNSSVAIEFACILWCEHDVLCTAAQFTKSNKNCNLIRSCSTPDQSSSYNTYVIQAFPDCVWNPSDSDGVWLVRDLGAIRTVELVMFEDKTVGTAQIIEGTMAIFVGNSSDPVTADTRNIRCAAVCNLSSNNLNAGYLCNNIVGRFVLLYRGYDKTAFKDTGLHIIYGY